jgi:hypothetical protein
MDIILNISHLPFRGNHVAIVPRRPTNVGLAATGTAIRGVNPEHRRRNPFVLRPPVTGLAAALPAPQWAARGFVGAKRFGALAGGSRAAECRIRRKPLGGRPPAA